MGRFDVVGSCCGAPVCVCVFVTTDTPCATGVCSQVETNAVPNITRIIPMRTMRNIQYDLSTCHSRVKGNPTHINFLSFYLCCFRRSCQGRKSELGNWEKRDLEIQCLEELAELTIQFRMLESKLDDCF